MQVDFSYTKKLLAFGSWITVSNVISPLMENIDRFIIGSLITLTAVSYYTTSVDLVLKLNIVPMAIASVLFPALSTLISNKSDRSSQIFSQSVRLLQLIVLPLILLICFFAFEILEFWLTEEFARNGTLVLQLFCLGGYYNNLAQISFATVQSANRPDLTAKIHMAEFPLFMALMWLLTVSLGIVGAAIARIFRLFIDHTLLHFFSSKLLNTDFRWFTVSVLPCIVIGTTIAFDSSTELSLLTKGAISAIFLSTYLVWAWNLEVTKPIRERLTSSVNHI